MLYRMNQKGEMVVQGREPSAVDIGLIHGLLAEHPEWGRTRLSEELCRLWDWRNTQDRTNDMAARTLLLRLDWIRQALPGALRHCLSRDIMQNIP